MSSFAVIDPATGTIHAEYPAATDAEVEAGLGAAQKTYQEWSRTTTVAERAVLAKRLADLFVERKDKLAAIINREMGKPLQQAVGKPSFPVPSQLPSPSTRKSGSRTRNWRWRMD